MGTPACARILNLDETRAITERVRPAGFLGRSLNGNAVAKIKVLLGADKRIVTVTGLDQQDDTAGLATRLATDLASLDNDQVLLVDGNFRDPKLQRRLKLEDRPGLADFLAGRGDVAWMTQRAILPNLSVMLLGNSGSPTPTALSGAAVSAAFEVLSEHFRWIVVDAGVITDSPEGIALGMLSDGVLVGIAAGKHRRHEVDQFVHDSARLGIKVLGAVMIEGKK